MSVKLKLIIKVFGKTSVKIIHQYGEIPSDYLSNLHPDIKFTISTIAKKYNLIEGFIDPKLVCFVIENNEPTVYYTITTPEEFLDESVLSQLTCDFLSFSNQDGVAVRQAILMVPY